MAPARWTRAWLGRRGAEPRLSMRTTMAVLLAFALAEPFGLAQGHWAVLTAVIVVQASVGGSLKAGIDRLAGNALRCGLWRAHRAAGAACRAGRARRRAGRGDGAAATAGGAQGEFPRPRSSSCWAAPARRTGRSPRRSAAWRRSASVAWSGSASCSSCCRRERTGSSTARRTLAPPADLMAALSLGASDAAARSDVARLNDRLRRLAQPRCRRQGSRTRAPEPSRRGARSGAAPAACAVRAAI